MTVDPEQALARLMALEHFGNAAVFIIDPDAVPDTFQAACEFLGDQLSCREAPLQKLFEQEIDSVLVPFFGLDTMTREVCRIDPFPRAIIEDGKNGGPGAAIIIAPGRSFDADNVVGQIGKLSRQGLPALTDGSAIFRYQALCHELGHVIVGAADEPGADRIEILMCRREFPDAIEPYIRADIRVLDSVYNASLLKSEEDRECGYSAMLLEYFLRNGWNCVEACDYVLNMPQEQVETMTDRDIIECRVDAGNVSNSDVLNFWKILRGSSFERMFDRGDLRKVAVQARLLPEAGEGSSFPALGVIARRFELAVRRLAGGAAAYAGTLGSPKSGKIFPAP